MDRYNTFAPDDLFKVFSNSDKAKQRLRTHIGAEVLYEKVLIVVGSLYCTRLMFDRRRRLGIRLNDAGRQLPGLPEFSGRRFPRFSG
jgi:hypothetical protein